MVPGEFGKSFIVYTVEPEVAMNAVRTDLFRDDIELVKLMATEREGSIWDVEATYRRANWFREGAGI